MKKFLSQVILIAFVSLNLIIPYSNAEETALFPDVFPNDPLNSALELLVQEKIIQGYSDGTFQPRKQVNRAEFTKMVITAKNIDVGAKDYASCFADTHRTAWYTPYVCEAYEQKWVKGFEDGLFHPEEKVDLSEALVILSKAFAWDLKNSDQIIVMPFADLEKDDWPLPYIEFAKEKLILQELSNFISPHRILNRKESAEYIYRTLLLSRGEKISFLKVGKINENYKTILSRGIKPAIPVDYDFPSKGQTGYPYACYGFAVINLMDYKFQLSIDPVDLGENIGWDYNFIWDDPQFKAFAAYYDTDLIMGYNLSPAYIFEKLVYGEPVVLYRAYYIDGKNVGHQAVAFSFDDNCVYFGDSANGSVTCIAYDDIFTEKPLGTTKNVTELRMVKGDGEFWQQSGL